MSDDDIFCELIDDTAIDPHKNGNLNPLWKVLIVDDEADVHNVTKLTIGNIKYLSRGLSLLHAYSGEEAKKILQEHHDVAVVFLDVVMENDHAGLDVVKFVRQELKNHTIRIVLRTGQPGQASEEEVVRNYDINDYKNKSELTAQKFRTSLYASLRGYSDIMELEKSTEDLELIINSTEALYNPSQWSGFAESVLTHITKLIPGIESAFYFMTDKRGLDTQARFHGIGRFANLNQASFQSLAPEIQCLIEKVREERHELYGEKYAIVYYCLIDGPEHMIYTEFADPNGFTEAQKKMFNLFCRHVANAYEVYMLRAMVNKNATKSSN